MKILVLHLILILALAFLPSSQVNAQETLDTAGLVFTPIESTDVDTSVTNDQSVVNSEVKPRATSASPATELETRSLLRTFVLGFLGGLAALIMPCIFPMLPMTVSFFTKGNDKGKGVGKALWYGASIIFIYVLIGLLITVIFGSDALNELSTNGIFNFFFFLLLVVFGASFLGAFELTLPSSWGNKMDKQADRGGLLGIFFMAATLALVSFSCTGPIIGTLLVDAATNGQLLGPAVGMFAFALALAIPFSVFAMFPKWLVALPKSGGWLNSIKIVLGLLELAFALKFLSNVDLAYHWNLFDREVFLVLWIAIFGLMALYLLGKVKFNHDSDIKYLSVPRTLFFLVVFGFTVYMIPGLFGAPLRSISAFLPPMSSQDFDLSGSGAPLAVENGKTKKYDQLFKNPKGFDPYFDYDEALAYAKKVNKPLLIDFTGHACVNCRKMEESVWNDPGVAKIINEKYVLLQLYVDDKTELTVEEQFTTPKGKHITTLGRKWSFLQTSKFKANSQPYYVLLNSATEEPIVEPQGADYEVNSYLKYLKSGLD